MGLILEKFLGEGEELKNRILGVIRRLLSQGAILKNLTLKSSSEKERMGGKWGKVYYLRLVDKSSPHIKETIEVTRKDFSKKQLDELKKKVSSLLKEIKKDLSKKGKEKDKRIKDLKEVEKFIKSIEREVKKLDKSFVKAQDKFFKNAKSEKYEKLKSWLIDAGHYFDRLKHQLWIITSEKGGFKP